MQAQVWEYWPSGKNLGWEPGDLIQIPVLDCMVQINETEWIVTMCYYKDVRILRWARHAYLQMGSSPLYSFPSRGRDILSLLSLFCLIFVFPVPAAPQALNKQRTKWSSHSRLRQVLLHHSSMISMLFQASYCYHHLFNAYSMPDAECLSYVSVHSVLVDVLYCG